MRERLARFLFDVHTLISDASRFRGTPPGAKFEHDVQALGEALSLRVERRVHNAPYDGVYYSGLRPETDLFVYDGADFIQLELKDLTNPISRFVATELWARALDLHLGRACNAFPSTYSKHYVALLAPGGADDRLRTACIRWGVWLLEPGYIPIALLSRVRDDLETIMNEVGALPANLVHACLAFNERFPAGTNGVVMPFGTFRTTSSVHALLELQRAASNLRRSFDTDHTRTIRAAR